MARKQENSSTGFSPGRRRGPGGGPGAFLAMPVEKAKNPQKTLKRLAGYLQPHVKGLLLVLLLAALATGFGIATPKIMGIAISELFRASVLDADLPSLNTGLIYTVVITLGCLYAAASLFRYLTAWFMAALAQETAYTLRKDVSEKLHKLPISWFDRHSHGDVLSRMTNDMDTVANTLQQGLTELLTAFLGMAGVLVMMLLISPLLTLVSLVVIPLSITTTRIIAKRSQRFFVRQQKVLGQLNGHVEEQISGHLLVKAFGGEEASVNKFVTHNDELYELGWKANFISGLIMPLMHVINNLGYILIAVIGGILVAGMSILIGDVQAFLQYSKQFGHPIIQISQIINVIQSTIAAAERVFEILDEKEEVDTAVSVNDFSERSNKAVRIHNLGFSYEPDTPLIRKLNLQVKAGQSVAIVGPTGAGKTTLVNLLLRFYDWQHGEIHVGEQNIIDVSREEIREIFGMVLQDPWLFNGSIYDNIAYSKDNASKEEVYAAAKAAQADHFIRTLPQGYNTMMNEEGSNLSAGQKQLLTIARAFLKDPEILILDEATSSVDTRTEVHVQTAMRKLLEGRTSFIIAHRLSTIRNADVILFMQDGNIVEQGTHTELLAKNSFYAEMYRSQYRVY